VDEFYWHCVRSDKFRGSNNSVFKQGYRLYRCQRTDDVAEIQSELFLAADIEVDLNANGCKYSVS
jgi:hypothetical protein